jgi:SAM-dependent methyltransferase
MSAAEFYDALAPVYHLSYADWSASIQRQARHLDALLGSRGLRPPASILDAACGIGTQSLGLAALGYSVSGSDISASAVERAATEAARRNLLIQFSVADLRSAHGHHGRTFDAVLACDNAIPHLLSDAEILSAFRELFRCTKPGGVCLISVRDYDVVDRTLLLQAHAPMVHEESDGRRIVFQVWAFEGEVYELSMYIVEDLRSAAPRVEVIRTRYYAVGTGTLSQLMGEAGFTGVERVDGAFFQPVLFGTRPAA